MGDIHREGSDLNKAMASKPEAAPAEPIIRQGGAKYVYQAGTDEMTVEGPRSYQTQQAEAADPLDRAMSQAGARVPRARLTENDIVDYYGTTRVKELVDMGVLVKDAAGGFAWAEGQAPVSTDPNTRKQDDAPEDDDAVSLEGVEGTSAGADLVKSQIREQAGEAVYNGLVTALISGRDITGQVAEIARRNGQPEEHVRESVEGVFSEYERSAKQVAAANGVPFRAWDSMVAWASEHAPDNALDAMTELVERHNAAPLARLARQFNRTGRVETAYSVRDVLSAKMGDGVSAYEKDGKAWVRLRGHDDMSFEKAVKAGLIRLS